VNTSNPAQILLRITGSLLAAIAGTLAGVFFMLLFGWDDWLACLTLIGFFAVPVWLLVLLPLHVLLPRSSPVWDPGASAGAGAGVGAVLLLAYFFLSGLDLLWLFLPVGILVGVATGLVGSAFARLYSKLTQ
jgi:hypothetical protein